MSVLRVTTRNWFFRWAYLFTTQRQRDCMGATTLCDMFWRSVLLTPFQLFCAAVPVVAISSIVIDAGVWNFARGLGVALGIITLVFGVAATIVFINQSIRGEKSNAITVVATRASNATQVVSEAVRGIKERYCPIVRVEAAE